MQYSIHDQEFIERTLVDMHGKLHVQAEAVKMATGQIIPVFDIDKALNASRKRYRRHMGETSKYAPHQGVNEIARRARQIETGKIRVN